MGRLLRIEKETTINYNEKEKMASIYTCNKKNIELLKKLNEEYPDDVILSIETAESITADLPKAWIKIVPPRKLTKEQREAAAQRMRAVRRQ